MPVSRRATPSGRPSRLAASRSSSTLPVSEGSLHGRSLRTASARASGPEVPPTSMATPSSPCPVASSATAHPGAGVSWAVARPAKPPLGVHDRKDSIESSYRGRDNTPSSVASAKRIPSETINSPCRSSIARLITREESSRCPESSTGPNPSSGWSSLPDKASSGDRTPSASRPHTSLLRARSLVSRTPSAPISRRRLASTGRGSGPPFGASSCKSIVNRSASEDS